MTHFNIETYLELIIENSTPKPHRSKWMDEAIRTRANRLDYGFYRNKDNGLTYFHHKIKHKYRRMKDEIQAWKESVPIPIDSNDSLGKDNNVAIDIIPKKQCIVYIKDMFTISLSDSILERLYFNPDSCNTYGSINAVSKVVVIRDSQNDREVTEINNDTFMGMKQCH